MAQISQSGKAGGNSVNKMHELIAKASLMGEDVIDKKTSRRYDADKIQNVQLITDHYGNWT